MTATNELIDRLEARAREYPFSNYTRDEILALTTAAREAWAERDRLAGIVRDANSVCLLLASIADSSAEEEIEIVQPGYKLISKGKVEIGREDWDVVNEATRLAVGVARAFKPTSNDDDDSDWLQYNEERSEQ